MTDARSDIATIFEKTPRHNRVEVGAWVLFGLGYGTAYGDHVAGVWEGMGLGLFIGIVTGLLFTGVMTAIRRAEAGASRRGQMMVDYWIPFVPLVIAIVVAIMLSEFTSSLFVIVAGGVASIIATGAAWTLFERVSEGSS